MKVKTCPSCGSSEIELFAGGITGAYRCKKCGYVGSLIVEKELFKK
jgi:uncharacterized Zn finger protein